MESSNEYRISFFKPTTERARVNRNMVVWLVSIWAVCIFGFHFLMKAIEKPTPEPELIIFQEVWDGVKSGTATVDEMEQFALSALHVTGKVFIQPEHRAALDNGISFAVFQLADSVEKAALSLDIQAFERIVEDANDLTDAAYVSARNQLRNTASSILNLSTNHVLSGILPYELKSGELNTLHQENIPVIETAMPLYMTHNRSVLTDMIILGFPFHYFYTAVFLLILFIGICWVYCFRVDRYNASVGIAE